MKELFSQLRSAVMATLVLAVVCCGLYPLIVFGIGQAAFRDQANGSLITDKDGTVRGSKLLGQSFTAAQYFHPRPSAAGNDGYDPTASGGSNYGPTSQKLIERVKASVEQFRKENPEYIGPIPADLLTASGSGLDPEISPAAAAAQAARIARLRHTTGEQVRRLITAHTTGPNLALLGEPRVNVLELNLDLDNQFPIR